jgi:hypothetical protein
MRRVGTILSFACLQQFTFAQVGRVDPLPTPKPKPKSRLEAFVEQLLYIVKKGPVPAGSPLIMHIGELLESSGDVRVRRANSFNFFEAEEGMLLYKRDRIYTGKESTALVRYSYQKESLISVPQFSIYEISTELPTSRILNRGYTRNKTDIANLIKDAKKINRETKDIFFGGAQEVDDQAGEEGNQSFAANQEYGLRLVFKMTEKELAFPRRDIFASLPESGQMLEINASLREPSDQVYVGYLWTAANPKQPTYSYAIGYGEKIFNIRITNPGTYVFQAFSDDSSSKTRSFKIKVMPKGFFNTAPIPTGVLPGDIILIN